MTSSFSLSAGGADDCSRLRSIKIDLADSRLVLRRSDIFLFSEVSLNSLTWHISCRLVIIINFFDEIFHDHPSCLCKFEYISLLLLPNFDKHMKGNNL